MFARNCLITANNCFWTYRYIYPFSKIQFYLQYMLCENKWWTNKRIFWTEEIKRCICEKYNVAFAEIQEMNSAAAKPGLFPSRHHRAKQKNKIKMFSQKKKLKEQIQFVKFLRLTLCLHISKMVGMESVDLDKIFFV